MPITRMPAAVRLPANRSTVWGTTPLPTPPQWGGPLSIFVTASGGVNTFYNAHFQARDYSIAINQDANAMYNPSSLGYIAVGQGMIGWGPTNIAAQLASAITDCGLWAPGGKNPWISFDDETTYPHGSTTNAMAVSRLLNGWIDPVGPTTTLLSNIGASDVSLQVSPTTRFIGDGLLPKATVQNAFPVTSQGYTIQFPNGEQVVVMTGTGTDTWGGLVRGVNTSYGGASGIAATSHSAGETITLIYADPGIQWVHGQCQTAGTELIYSTIGALITPLVALGPPYTLLASLAPYMDGYIHQLERLFTDPTNIAAAVAQAATNVAALRAVLGSKLLGVQTQCYDPFGNAAWLPYTVAMATNIINAVGEACNPDFITLYYGSYSSTMESIMVPNYRT